MREVTQLVDVKYLLVKMKILRDIINTARMQTFENFEDQPRTTAIGLIGRFQFLIRGKKIGGGFYLVSTSPSI